MERLTKKGHIWTAEEVGKLDCQELIRFMNLLTKYETEEEEGRLVRLDKAQEQTELEVKTPIGVTIHAEVILDPEYPGISLFYEKSGNIYDAAVLGWDSTWKRLWMPVWGDENCEDYTQRFVFLDVKNMFSSASGIVEDKKASYNIGFFKDDGELDETQLNATGKEELAEAWIGFCFENKHPSCEWEYVEPTKDCERDEDTNLHRTQGHST